MDSSPDVSGQESNQIDLGLSCDSSLFVTNPIPNSHNNSRRNDLEGPSFAVDRSIRFSSVSKLANLDSETHPETHPETDTIAMSKDKALATPKTQPQPDYLTSPIREKLAREDVSSIAESSFSRNRNLSRLLRGLSSGSEIEFQNSSFLDDTGEQFDLDINLDDHKPTRAPEDQSFWLACKSASPQKFTVGQRQYLTQRKLAADSVSDINSNARIAELTKLLTNCKIQIRLYEKFLQDLIEKHSVDAGDLEILHQLWNAGSLANSLPFVDPATPTKDPATESELADITALVEDLHESLEDFQNRWKEADQRATSLDHILRDWSSELVDLLQLIGCEKKIDLSLSPQEIMKAAQPLLLEYLQSSASKKNGGQHDEFEMRKRFEHLNLSDRGDVKPNDTVHEPLSPSDSQQSINISQESLDDYLPTSEEVADAFKVYQARIDELQDEVEALKEANRKSSSQDLSEQTIFSNAAIGKEDNNTLQREHEALQLAYKEFSERFRVSQENASTKINSLTNQLNNQKREVSALRSNIADFDGIQRELDAAVEKQRVLTSEKIRLSYEVESLQNDKESLRNTIDNLTRELLRQRTPVQQVQDTTTVLQDEIYAKLFNDVFLADMRYFQRLLASFNKIADDKSLVEPTRKLESLAPLCAKLLLLTPETVAFALDHHNSVFGFFAKAVDVIVKDHIKLLLKQEEDKVVTKKRHQYLVQHIEELEKQLKLEKENLPQENQYRIDELTNRWKAEREARVSESRAAQRRFNELRVENSKFANV